MMTVKFAAVTMVSATVFLLFVRALWVLAEAPWHDNGLSVMLSLFVGCGVAAMWRVSDGDRK